MSKKILILVESPGKISKLQNLLGSDYIIMASVGHVIDLDPKILSIDIENDFAPTYIVTKDDVVSKIMAAMKKASQILLAADPDREGEFIAYSLLYVVGMKNKSLYNSISKTAKRISFNSITKSEIKNAVANPREIDRHLVCAQKARRILDRIVGYELSPVLWKYRAKTSAGRVQSVVVRIIVDRESEIDNFWKGDLNSYFTSESLFLWEKETLKCSLFLQNKEAKLPKDEARKTLELIIKSTFKIKVCKEHESKNNAPPPFTTSSLQQEAGRKLGFTVKQTMSVAQTLYNQGYITYMRTDSVNLSAECLADAEKYIKETIGEQYYQQNVYKSKGNTQEAHEACRVSHIKVDQVDLGDQENKLYNLIWKRTVASQMKPAIYNVLDIVIEMSKLPDYTYRTSIKTLLFPGWLIVYNKGKQGEKNKKKKKNNEENNEEIDEENDENENCKQITKLPKVGDKTQLEKVNFVQEYQKPPFRFNEVSLVDLLDPKNLNIGRPSTYATIINKVQDRTYVEKKDLEGKTLPIVTWKWESKTDKIEEEEKTIVMGKEKNKLVPTELGKIVTNVLVEHFPTIMDYKFTAKMEEKLDQIANGELNWVEMMKDFYKDFHALIEHVKSIKLEIKYDNSNDILIGTHPESQKEIFMSEIKGKRVVKYEFKKGKLVFIDIEDDVDLPTAVALIEERTKYPLKLGKHNNEQVILNKGPYSYYLKYSGKNITVPNEKITLDEAVEIITEKFKNVIKTIKGKNISYTILNGPYGPYIQSKPNMGKGKNVPVPKELNPEDLELEHILDIFKNYKPKRFIKNKTKKEK